MTKGRKKKNTPRSGKLPGVPKFKIWFPSEPFFNIFWKDRTEIKLLELSRRMNVPAGNLKKTARPGTLIRESTADSYAIKVGYHPMMIWPDWFSEEPEEGSNPKFTAVKKAAALKRYAKEQAHIVYTDTTQPPDCNQE
jgi:hypothetical protein